MATLQKIRSKGPLLLIVIGLAMLAFILGDAWKIIRPNQGVQFVGTIAGKDISAMDFQDELEKYTEVIKFGMGTSDLTEEQSVSLKNEVWSTMVRNIIIENEVEKLGLAVTDAEVRNFIEDGTDPILASTPFSNAEGKFDADNLKSFIAGYESLDRESVPAEEMNYYDNLYKFWLYIEKEIKSQLLWNKYSSLVSSSLITNPVAEKNSYNNRIRRADALVAQIPFNALSQVDITENDIKATYNKNKERLYNYSETRNLYYIDCFITPSEADRQALAEEMNDITSQLEEQTDDYASFVRRSQSLVTFSEVARSADYLPDDVVSNLDSINSNGVFGPYYNEMEDTYNAFKLISAEKGYDSIQFCLMQVATGAEDEDARLTDSICGAIKGGADIEKIASAYSQSAAPQWIASASYEPASISGDNAKYLNALNSMKKGEVRNVRVANGNLIIKVTDVRNVIDKYVVAVVKRPVEFSEETSNKAYTELSLFVAQNNTLDSLKANVDNSDFHLLYLSGYENARYYIGDVAKSHEALRWAFEAEAGDVSRIYEVGESNDHLLVVAVDKINKEGYTSVGDAANKLSFEVQNDKKAQILMTKLSAAKSIEDAQSIEGVKVDTVEFCNFTNDAYIASTMTNEPALGPSIMNLSQNELTKPIQGQSCVFIAKKISDDTISAEFDSKSEQNRLKVLASSRIAQSILQELYFQAHVSDIRYKIF